MVDVCGNLVDLFFGKVFIWKVLIVIFCVVEVIVIFKVNMEVSIRLLVGLIFVMSNV